METIKIGCETGDAGSLHPSLSLHSPRFSPKPHVAFMLHCITLLCSILHFKFLLLQQKERNYYFNQKKNKMTSTKHLLLVLCLGICVGMCRSWVEDVAEENTESLSHSARNTFSQ